MTTTATATDLYRSEPAASAISTAQLIHAGEFELADVIVMNTDPQVLLEGFTNVLGLAVQLISRYGGVPESEVFGLIRAANREVEGAANRPNRDDVSVSS